MAFYDNIRVSLPQFWSELHIECLGLETVVNYDFMDLVFGGCVNADILVNDYLNMCLYK